MCVRGEEEEEDQEQEQEVHPFKPSGMVLYTLVSSVSPFVILEPFLRFLVFEFGAYRWI
jgi:hypothetical protein